MNIQITKYHGFTLIELIATIAVIAVIALSAGPELGTFLSRNKLTTQTNNFVSSLNLARSEAAKRAINITVCVSNTAQDDCDVTNWENGWIVFDFGMAVKLQYIKQVTPVEFFNRNIHC